MGEHSLICLRKKIFLLMSLVIFLNNHAGADEGDKRYLSIRIADERLGISHVVLGRVFDGKATMVSAGANGGLIETTVVLSAPQDQRAVEPSGLELSFSLPAKRVEACERQREARSFLAQLDLFKGYVREFELTATSEKFTDCIKALVSRIAAKGYRTSVAFRNMSEGGIAIRAALGKGAQGEGPVVTLVSVEASGAGPSRRATPGVDGYFALSFANDPGLIKISFLSSGILMAEAAGIRPRRFELGESRDSIFGFTRSVLASAAFDSVSVEAIPAGMLEAAVKDAESRRELSATSIGWRMDSFTFGGSGVAGNTRFLPAHPTFRHRLNAGFFLDADGVAPIAPGPAPWTFLRTRLNRWIVGRETFVEDPFEGFRFGAGAGLFFLRHRPAAPDRVPGGLVLTDLLGVSASLRLEYRGREWSVGLINEWSPVPKSQSAEASLSMMRSLEAERCFFGGNHCGAIGYADERYETKVVGLGVYDLSVRGPFLSYRLVLK